jgi:hypothetical protein
MRTPISPEEKRWRARAGAVARRVNFGWWWHRLSPPLVGVNLAGAAALLLFRQMRWPLEAWAGLLGLAWLVAAGWAWARARMRFYAQPEGLLRLETHLGWHNVLSAAAAGGLGWPELPGEPVRPLQWRWVASAQPVLASVAFLLAALFIPVSAPPKPALPPPTQLPPALQQVQSWTEKLKEQNLVQPATMESWEERLAQLKQKPQQEWYGQESLEAAESLRNQLAQEINTMDKNLKKTADLVAALQALPPGAAIPADLRAALNQQIAALQNSNLPLGQSLAQSLNNLQSLSPSQLAYFMKQLQQGADGLGFISADNAIFTGQFQTSQDSAKAQLGQYGQGRPGSWPAGSMNGPSGTGGQSNPGGGLAQPGGSGPAAQDDESMCDTATGPGGGPGGGGGSNGISYQAPTDVQAKNQQGVSNNRSNSAMPGDLVGISISAPTRNPQDGAPAGAGGAASQGGEGDAVWRQDLTPQERALLQQYFK